MKKLIVGVTVITLLAIGVIGYAHGPNWFGGGYGHMSGPGYGGHMMGWKGEYDQKFLDETKDIRKELHNKKFEYSEAIRNPETTSETVTKLEQEIQTLQEKLYAKAPRGTYRGFRHCWEY